MFLLLIKSICVGHVTTDLVGQSIALMEGGKFALVIRHPSCRYVGRVSVSLTAVSICYWCSSHVCYIALATAPCACGGAFYQHCCCWLQLSTILLGTFADRHGNHIQFGQASHR